MSLSVDLDSLKGLLARKAETDDLEFKSQWDPDQKADLIELCKDIAAMESLPDGGYIIVGVDGPVFIETNVSPGMTETSLVPLAVEAAGEDFGRLCAALVRQAYSRGPSGVRG